MTCSVPKVSVKSISVNSIPLNIESLDYDYLMIIITVPYITFIWTLLGLRIYTGIIKKEDVIHYYREWNVSPTLFIYANSKFILVHRPNLKP